jgi:hydrogenase nickel incorporation protein HypA/HybF
MHEVALARGLLEIVERTLTPRVRRVVRVNVSVGAAAGIVSESLTFAFLAIAEGTRAQGAELVITTVPARSRCRVCNATYAFEGIIGRCPGCGSLGGELQSGNEMVLRTIEVADV